MAFHVLMATIPSRRAPCERLLHSLVQQTRAPNVVQLVLDGYCDDPCPSAPAGITIREWRTAKKHGPGGRWHIAKSFAAHDVVVVLDDDVVVAAVPTLIEKLEKVVESGSAAATRGVTVSGQFALVKTSEKLICMGAASMALRAGWLEGLDELASDVRKKFDFDPLGDCGDDEALVSAHLWMQGISMQHVFAPEIGQAHDSQRESQTMKRIMTGRPFWRQREAISQLTGWPWRLAS